MVAVKNVPMDILWDMTNAPHEEKTMVGQEVQDKW